MWRTLRSWYKYNGINQVEGGNPAPDPIVDLGTDVTEGGS
jgi:hypothetical protein